MYRDIEHLAQVVETHCACVDIYIYICSEITIKLIVN